MSKMKKSDMVSAIQGMMQGMGISSVEFADDDGSVHGKIKVPKPKNVPCDVPAYGGGTVSIRQGDHIRLWYRDEYSRGWSVEGAARGQESVGRVICVRPSHYDGSFDLAYQRDNSASNEGPSSCIVMVQGSGWARAVEKIS